MRVLDVFTCLGFHHEGTKAAEHETVAMCEANEWRREQLSRNYPGIKIYDDITTMPAVPADVIFGGPPCQQTSVGAAISGRRSGATLWPAMLDLGLRSGVEWFVVEQPIGNDAWETEVNRSLCEAGFHVARFEFGAHDVGAPYPRRRVYIIACSSLPRLEVAWSSGPWAIKRVAGAALARGDWRPDTIPPFCVGSWRSENVSDRKEAIEALGDSNPPAMAEVIGWMLNIGERA